MAQSRISRLEEKRTKKQLYLSIIGIIGVIIFMITIGIPMIVRGSAYLGTVRQQNTPIETNGDTIAPFPPTLSALPEATNTSPITVEGYAEPGSQLTLFVNGEEVKQNILGEDGSFSFSDIELTKGENRIYATAKDISGNESGPSHDLVISYKKDAPKLEVTAPEEGQSFGKNDQEITVTGKTDPGNNMRINERFVSVAEDGSFAYKLKLSDGENTLTIVARDDAGNETKLERKVTYNP